MLCVTPLDADRMETIKQLFFKNISLLYYSFLAVGSIWTRQTNMHKPLLSRAVELTVPCALRLLCAPELPSLELAQAPPCCTAFCCCSISITQLWGIWAFRGPCAPSNPEGLSSSHWSVVQAAYCTSENRSRGAEKAICCHRNSRTLFYCAGWDVKVLLFGLFPGNQIENC